jgi:glycosyltransferase involved in cell wall biosynthesis
VIVADNKSTDSTPEVIHKYASEYPEIIQYVREYDIQSSYAARNTGVSKSQGDILAFIDADMWVDDNYISDIYSYMQQSTAEYVGLPVSLEAEEKITTLGGEYDRLTGFTIQRYMNKNEYTGAGCLVMRRSAFEEMGGFDNRLISGGDKIFGKQVAEAGLEQAFCEEVTVYHPVRDSTRAMLRKAVRLGRGKAQQSQHYPELSDEKGLRDLRVYLPPHPIRMKELVSGRDDEITWRKFILIYLFAIVYKYVQLYGIIEESL